MEKDDKMLVDKIKEELNDVSLKCYNCNEKSDHSIHSIPNSCPFCGFSNWWYKPEKERKLFILQDKYIKSNKNPKYLSELYEPLKEYTRFAILKKLKNKKLMSTDELEIKIEDTVGKVFIYLSDEKRYPNWRVDDSWWGMISMVLLDTLYNRKKAFNEKQSSLDGMIAKDKPGNDTKLQDMIESFGYRSIYEKESNTEQTVLKSNSNIVTIIVELIEQIVQKLQFTKGDKTSLYVLIGLKYVLQNKKAEVMQNFFDYAGYEVEELVNKFTEVIVDYIKMENDSYEG